MTRIAGALLTLGALSWSCGEAAAAEHGYHCAQCENCPYASACPVHGGALFRGSCDRATGCASACRPYCGCGCPLCAFRHACRRCGQRLASTGNFNCQCQGSYKHPALPQYTYHWPGMYSQATMTEYGSPFRFPALRDPDEVFGADSGAALPLDPTRDGPPSGSVPEAPRVLPQSSWRPMRHGP